VLATDPYPAGYPRTAADHRKQSLDSIYLATCLCSSSRSPYTSIGSLMIVLGIILLLIGYFTGLSILYTIGGILVVIGIVLWILGAVGRPVGGRKVWF
jgi:hypothetical protein